MKTTQENVVLSVGAQTERGRREENQDNMTGFTSPFGPVYIVADGMGGHQGGAEASRIVVDTFREYLRDSRDRSLQESLQDATSAANAALLARGTVADPSVAGMGSTVVLAAARNLTYGTEVWIGHIGDSRAYLLRDGALRQLTRDHSAVQRLVEAQMVSPEEARTHPDASVLTRALGQQPEVALDLSRLEALQPGDVLLLCSDGLSGYVPDEQIRGELIVSRSAPETARALISLALDNGSDDNITVQVLRVSESSLAQNHRVALNRDAGLNADDSDHQRSDLIHPRGVPRTIITHALVGILAFALGLATPWLWHLMKPANKPSQQQSASPESGQRGGRAGQAQGAGAPPDQHRGRQGGTVTRGGSKPSASTPRQTNPQQPSDEDTSH